MEKTIYHGSDHIIEKPKFGYGKPYETADSKEWYKKKAFRDQTARRQYFDVERNRRQRGDLYVTTILDEEMKPNDPRLR